MKKRAVKYLTSNYNSFGTASVVLSIVSLVFPSYYGIVPGIVALVFALKQRHDSNNNWALWGLTLSIIGIVLNLLDILYGSQTQFVAEYIKSYRES
ncbi:DUF4190 domain-containing protein [Candidatus Pacearchaeota archaeon]|nr:DUF4190 domain-containing protein [Candidatus Pacearchaeota archaeon]